eukprot:COSAG05_NODE_1784_length_4092_cov_122.148175_2_plen_97_part_00
MVAARPGLRELVSVGTECFCGFANHCTCVDTRPNAKRIPSIIVFCVDTLIDLTGVDHTVWVFLLVARHDSDLRAAGHRQFDCVEALRRSAVPSSAE